MVGRQSKGYKVIVYKRGDLYSCRVSYNREQDVVTCHDIQYPPEASGKIIEQFLEEAQVAMFKKIDAEENESKNG